MRRLEQRGMISKGYKICLFCSKSVQILEVSGLHQETNLVKIPLMLMIVCKDVGSNAVRMAVGRVNKAWNERTRIGTRIEVLENYGCQRSVTRHTG